MSKKNRRISFFIFGILLMLVSMVTSATPPKAPNQLITENPYKEVTTIEAKKNREHAEMNLTVNKIIPKEIEGILLKNGNIIVQLPEEEQLEKNYYITNSLDNISNRSSKKNKREVNNGIKYELEKNIMTIEKNSNEKLYIFQKIDSPKVYSVNVRAPLNQGGYIFDYTTWNNAAIGTQTTVTQTNVNISGYPFTVAQLLTPNPGYPIKISVNPSGYGHQVSQVASFPPGTMPSGTYNTAN